MKITIRSTSKLIEFRHTQLGESMPARIWEGETETGIPVHCFITRISPTIDRNDPRQAQFQTELRECAAPSTAVGWYPASLIL